MHTYAIFVFRSNKNVKSIKFYRNETKYFTVGSICFEFAEGV